MVKFLVGIFHDVSSVPSSYLSVAKSRIEKGLLYVRSVDL